MWLILWRKELVLSFFHLWNMIVVENWAAPVILSCRGSHCFIFTAACPLKRRHIYLFIDLVINGILRTFFTFERVNWIALVPIMFPPLTFRAQLPLGIDIYEDKWPWKRSSKHGCFIRVKGCFTKSHMILSLCLSDWFTYICSLNFQ